MAVVMQGTLGNVVGGEGTDPAENTQTVFLKGRGKHIVEESYMSCK